MSIPAKPTLTTPPTAPVRGEDRASFATKANNYVVFIGTNVTDLTAAIDWQNTVFAAVESAADDAAQSVVDAAEKVVLAADQVTLAENQVALAADQVTLAEAAASAAGVTANADAWVSGASYSVNDNAISQIDFKTYRAKSTFTGQTTDPSEDATRWANLIPDVLNGLATSLELQRYNETVATGSATLDRADGGIQTFTMTANITLAVTIAAGESLTFHLSAGDTYAVTWPTITWVGGSVPTLTADDVIEFWKIGSTLYGAYVGAV